MGLDMYLKAKVYHGEYFGDKVKAAELAKLFPSIDKNSNGIYVEATVKYWRKENAIHAWFVRELAEGKDECQNISVEKEDIARLIADIEKTIENKAAISRDPKRIAEFSNLIPTSGFFFGSTEIDEYFWQGLESTAADLKKLLAPEWKDYEFVYRAIW